MSPRDVVKVGATEVEAPPLTPSERKRLRWARERAKLWSEFLREAGVLILVFGAIMAEHPPSLPDFMMNGEKVNHLWWGLCMLVLAGVATFVGFAVEKRRH